MSSCFSGSGLPPFLLCVKFYLLGVEFARSFNGCDMGTACKHIVLQPSKLVSTPQSPRAPATKMALFFEKLVQDCYLGLHVRQIHYAGFSV